MKRKKKNIRIRSCFFNSADNSKIFISNLGMMIDCTK